MPRKRSSDLTVVIARPSKRELPRREVAVPIEGLRVPLLGVQVRPGTRVNLVHVDMRRGEAATGTFAIEGRGTKREIVRALRAEGRAP